LGIGTLAGLGVGATAQAATGRTTDTVRLTWGLSGLNLIAKERGEFEKDLARDGIKVEWLGPFPNHAPTLQAVTGRRRLHHAGARGHHRRLAPGVHAIRRLRAANHRDHRQGRFRHQQD
jgi:hypothetical protein